MGSFSELTLAFGFVDDTPVEVLAAFVEWRTGDGAPELPDLEALMGADSFDAAFHAADSFGGDPMAGLSSLHRAAMFRYLAMFGENSYYPGTPTTVLRWNGRRWTLTMRELPKESGDTVQAIVSWLGEWAQDGEPEAPAFVGYIADEDSPRPVLIWSPRQAAVSFRRRLRTPVTARGPSIHQHRSRQTRGRASPSVCAFEAVGSGGLIWVPGWGTFGGVATSRNPLGMARSRSFGYVTVDVSGLALTLHRPERGETLRLFVSEASDAAHVLLTAVPPATSAPGVDGASLPGVAPKSRDWLRRSKLDPS